MSRSKWKGQYTDHYLLKKIRRIQKISGKKMKDFNKHLVNFDTQIQEIKNNVIKFATKFDLYV